MEERDKLDNSVDWGFVVGERTVVIVSGLTWMGE